MALSNLQKEEISALLEKKIEDKLKRYARETTSMPFLVRLIQDSEKVAAYSFIHSIATSLGMSIYEDVSVIIARSTAQKAAIQDIIRRLRNKERAPNISDETTKVLKVSPQNGKYQKEGSKVDF